MEYFTRIALSKRLLTWKSQIVGGIEQDSAHMVMAQALGPHYLIEPVVLEVSMVEKEGGVEFKGSSHRRTIRQPCKVLEQGPPPSALKKTALGRPSVK